MTLTRRERVRQATVQEIKDVARKQMAEQGAAAISLGAIAREMGMTPPALYRYFSSRDALVTELIVDAYQALGDALEAAYLANPQGDYAARFQGLCHAFRRWAQAHPQDYALIYGTPIPHYHAPRERTVPLASRVVTFFGLLLGEAMQAGQLTVPPAYRQIPPTLQRVVDRYLAELPVEGATPDIFVLAMLIWSRLNGHVWAELQGHFPPDMTGSGELFQMEVTAICQELVLGSGEETQ